MTRGRGVALAMLCVAVLAARPAGAQSTLGGECASTDEACYWREAEARLDRFESCLSLAPPKMPACSTDANPCRWNRLGARIDSLRPHLDGAAADVVSRIDKCAADGGSGCRLSDMVSTFAVLSSYVAASPDRGRDDRCQHIDGAAPASSVTAASLGQLPEAPSGGPQASTFPGQKGSSRERPHMWLMQNIFVVVGLGLMGLAAVGFVISRVRGAGSSGGRGVEPEQAAVGPSVAVRAPPPSAPPQPATVDPATPAPLAQPVFRPAPPEPEPVPAPPPELSDDPPPPAIRTVNFTLIAPSVVRELAADFDRLDKTAARPEKASTSRLPGSSPREDGRAPTPVEPASDLMPEPAAMIDPVPTPDHGGLGHSRQAPEPDGVSETSPSAAPPADVSAPPLSPSGAGAEQRDLTTAEVDTLLSEWLTEVSAAPQGTIGQILADIDAVADDNAYDRLKTVAARRLAAAFTVFDFHRLSVLSSDQGALPIAHLVDRILGDAEPLIWPLADSAFDPSRHERIDRNAGASIVQCVRPGLALAGGVFRALVRTA